jgi:hypothetical protein
MRKSEECPNAIMEYFINRNTPLEFCNIHQDIWRLQDFLRGDRALETDIVTWPDQPSIGAEAALMVESRDRLRAIIDAEAPPPVQ